MNVGKLQRRWAEDMPQVYNKETRIVCLDIRAEKQKDMDGNEVDGFSYLPVEIDRQIDYGHVKSQLIEAGFAQKDEFGLLMNAVESLINGEAGSVDIVAFNEFCEFRKMCAEAAKQVLNCYK